jgi:hypothetical protein
MSKPNSNISSSDTLKYSTEQFDKNITMIASGALAVSFAFIKDIIPNISEATDKQYLIGSWYIFSSVIFLSLITHFISMLANTWAVKNSNLKDNEFNNGIMKWNWPIRILNLSMIVAILIGAFKLVNFINQNI